MDALRFIKFSGLQQWDIKRFVQTSFSSHMPIVPLGDHIIEQSKKYDISNPKQIYGILGVNNKTGIFDAYQESGAKIKQKYKRMENGWIAYNPYRVNVGSIGIKKAEHTHDFISPAYVVFSCKSDLLPEYLYLLMKTSLFNKIIQENTTGSVRQNLSFKVLKRLRIPCPTIKEQFRIVANYNKFITEAEIMERKSKQLKSDIEKYLSQILGIVFKQDIINTGLNFRRLKNVSRWDIWNIKESNYQNNFRQVFLKDVIHMKSGVFLPSSSQKGTKYKVYGGNGITGFHDEYNFTGKRIIIGRVGEYCGNIHLVDGTYWVTDNAFLTDKISDEVSWEYLEIVLSNLNLNSLKSISAQPSISKGRILQQQISVPPLEVQDIIVIHISNIKNQIEFLNQQAIYLRNKVLKDFDNEIFE